MRFYGLALLTSAFVLGACGGGGEQQTQQNEGTTDTTATAPAGGTTGAAPAGAAAPITGTTHEVKMVGDAQGYRFEPAKLTIKQGDGVKWVMVSGAPHNVAFDVATVPAAAKTQLAANMPNQMSELTGPLLMNANESYTVSFANVAPGTYTYVCTPHASMGMKAEITVQ